MLNGSRQSQIVSLAATLAALALVGCGGGVDHPHTTAGATASASFSWSIYDIGDRAYQTSLLCDHVGASQVVITLLSADTGQTYANAAVASCSAWQATTYAVPPGYYTVGFDLYGDQQIYGNSSTVLDSFDSDTTVYLGPGMNDFRNSSSTFVTLSFVVDWNLYSTSLGRYISCNPGEEVDLVFFRPGSQTEITSTFYCSDLSGFSFPIPIDYQSVQWSMFLVDPTTGLDTATIKGGVLSIPTNITADIDLGMQTFQVP
jgi:hypothetical protein